MQKTHKIGFGGGCHWCTEAVFQSLKGVNKVAQGFIAPKENDTALSEAVIVRYDAALINLKDLVEIHLHTHNSTSAHSMRDKYRSAIYAFDEETVADASVILEELQYDFERQLVTKVYLFGTFKPSDVQFHNYYYSNPEKPFCETYISPKLGLLMKQFSNFVEKDSINKRHEVI